jgi:DNA mismatch endonuclease (patch repair protein)
MVATRRRDTPAELALRSALTRYGCRYRVDWPLPGTRRRADVAFPRHKIAVFVDGCFWHGCPKHRSWPKTNAEWWRAKLLANVARDRHTDAHLKSFGWRVFRFWAHADMMVAAKRVVAATTSPPLPFRRAQRERPSA